MKSFYTVMLSAVCLLALSACGGAEKQVSVSHQDTARSVPPSGVFKVGRKYKVAGRSYKPRETYDFTQTGIASWYGPKFHGKQTANGERYNQYALTAAHKTLQMPSIVRVTNLNNGQSIIVRVNDRGPFSRGRIIDMSKRGAELLGFIRQGTAKVRVQVMPEESRLVADAAKRGVNISGVEIALNQGKTVQEFLSDRAGGKTSQVAPLSSQSASFAPVTASPDTIYVQAAAFTSRDTALSYAQRFSDIAQAHVEDATVHGQPFYRVKFGPLDTEQQAQSVVNRLAQFGEGHAVILGGQ